MFDGDNLDTDVRCRIYFNIKLHNIKIIRKEVEKRNNKYYNRLADGKIRWEVRIILLFFS